MAHQLTQVEPSHRTVSSGQRRLILFHPASAKLAAVFGVADQGLDARSAIHKAGVTLRLTFR